MQQLAAPRVSLLRKMCATLRLVSQPHTNDWYDSNDNATVSTTRSQALHGRKLCALFTPVLTDWFFNRHCVIGAKFVTRRGWPIAGREGGMHGAALLCWCASNPIIRASFAAARVSITSSARSCAAAIAPELCRRSPPTRAGSCMLSSATCYSCIQWHWHPRWPVDRMPPTLSRE